MNSDELLKVVQQYNLKNDAVYDGFKVIRLPDQKTVFVEITGEIGRAITLSMFKVGKDTYWAGYSTRSQTVYISQAAAAR